MSAKQMSVEEFDTKVLGNDRPVLVKVGASWCGPCQEMAPIVAELTGELAGTVDVHDVDLDTSRSLAQRLEVESVPTFRVFHAGEPKGEPLVGAVSKADLLKWMQEAIAS